MPIFSIQTPRGDTVDINAADQDSAIRGAQAWDMEDFAHSEAQRLGVDPGIAVKMMRQESNSRADAHSGAGAIGPMQLMPETAKDLGVDPNDPYQNITGGLTYYKQQRDHFGRDDLALAAYNAGPGAVAKHGGIPPFDQTQKYVGAILGSDYKPPEVGGGDAQGGDAASLGAPPLPRRLVIDAETRKPYNDAQQAAYGRLMDAGQLDPGAKPGSKAFPRGMVAGGAPRPGEWYVDVDGSVKLQPDLTTAEKASDVGQSFVAGADRSTAGFLDDLLHFTNPVPVAMDLGRKAAAVGSWLAGTKTGPLVPQTPTASGMLTSDLHKPQTTAGRGAEAGGEMLPNVITPGGIVRKTAAVALPALGMVAGEDAAKALGGDENWQQAGRMIGAVAAGAASSMRPQLPQRPPRITPEQLRSQADALYTELRNRSVQFTPRAVQSLDQGLTEVMKTEGANLYPTHANWVGQVAQTMRENPSVEALAKVRSKLQQALTTPTGSTTPDQLRVGKALVDEIDDFMAAAARHPETMTTTTPQNAARVQDVLGQARDLWRKMRNVQTVENLIGSASIQNQTSHMGGNVQNMTARKLRTFIDPSTNKSLAGLSPDEQAQLRRAVLGTGTSNMLKLVGNLSPTKGIGALLNTVAAGMFGPHGPMVIAPVGFAANRAGGAVQAAELDRLIRMLASGQAGQRAGVRPAANVQSLAHPLLGPSLLVPQAVSATPSQHR